MSLGNSSLNMEPASQASTYTTICLYCRLWCILLMASFSFLADSWRGRGRGGREKEGGGERGGVGGRGEGEGRGEGGKSINTL